MSIMLISALLSCTGQLLWKLSSGGTDTRALLLLFGGYVCYGLGMLCMLIGYRYGELSVLHPVLSAGYVISLILGAAVLHEPVSAFKVLGVVAVLCGVVLIGGGNEDAD